MVVGGSSSTSTEILTNGSSAWKTVGSLQIYGRGVQVVNYDNMLLSFGNVPLIMLMLSFNELNHNRRN